MKLFVILSILFSTFNCSQSNSLLKIEYKAATRGASKYISVTQKDCHFNILDNISTYDTKKEDWETIKNLIDQIDLQNIENLERPSEQSYTDAAMSASLIFTFKDKSIESSSFDDGNSPKELQKIVVKLLSLVSE